MMELLLSHPIGLIALILGYILLVAEMYIPGFGIPGISGLVLAVVGVLALEPTLVQALTVVAVYVLLLCIALVFCMRSASKGWFAKSRLVLKEVANVPEAQERYAVGMQGVAQTPLRPCGIAEFDGSRVNVSSSGAFIEAGSALRIISVQGKNIVVEKA